jgi:hypothetical protein
MHHPIRFAAVALAALASAAGAQQTTARGTTSSNVNACAASSTVEQYSSGDVTITRSKTTGNVYVRDTTAKETRANVGGGSVPLSSVNLPKTAPVDNGARPDSVKVIAPLNAEQTAVRVNVGGGSTAITHVDNANTNVRDTTKTRPTSCPTPDTERSQKPLR